MELAGRIALVSGGSAGIGKAVAMKLGLAGAALAICGRSRKRLRSAALELEEAGIEVYAEVCEVPDLGQIEDFVKEVAARYARIDILVNNVGALQETWVARPDDSAWSKVLGTNLDGAYYLTTRVVPHMPEGGRIVNIAGVLGKIGVAGSLAYCASKHGLIGFTRSAALELAPRGITVNAICPGWVETEMACRVMEEMAAGAGKAVPDVRADVLSNVPLGEMIQPEEIAALVSFLVSSTGRNITGQAYNLSGGQIMH
jgi:ketoreductase